MDLHQFLQERKDSGHKLSELEAVVLMLKIAKGVRCIHSMHMAHRDLKPGNVLVNVEVDPLSKLSRACSVKITDFGLTKTKKSQCDIHRPNLEYWYFQVYGTRGH